MYSTVYSALPNEWKSGAIYHSDSFAVVTKCTVTPLYTWNNLGRTPSICDTCTTTSYMYAINSLYFYVLYMHTGVDL